jgi:hypothetical protein
VFDNEFYTKNSSVRMITGNFFSEITDTMFHYPHTFFNPKTGPIIMSPNFIVGMKSQIIYMYDYKITNARSNTNRVATTEIRRPPEASKSSPSPRRMMQIVKNKLI